MSWKPKTISDTLKFIDGSAEGLIIKYRKKMTIRELNQIQKLSTTDATTNMEALCDILASKIISWNYEEVKPSGNALMDLPHDITSEITSKLMDAIIGSNDNTNLVEPSPNGLNLEEVSGVMAQQ